MRIEPFYMLRSGFLKKSIAALSRIEGQLLVEMLVALVIGGLLTLTASIALVSLVRYNFENQGGQNGSALAYNLMSAVSSFAENGWHNIYDLNKTSGSQYYLISGTTSSLAIAGNESVFFNDVEAGLIGQWKFDESTGTVAYDSSGNGMNGTFNGELMRATSSCYAANCLAFDGKTSFVSAASSSPINTLSAFSLSAWIYPTSSGALMNIISKGGSYGLQYNNTQTIIFVVQPSFGAAHTVTGATALPLNTWSQAVATFDGTTMRLYVNGAADPATNVSGVPTATTSPFLIGSDAATVSPFAGDIDDVRVYNRALLASEVSSLYNNKPYTRYFYIDNVSRDGSGNIVAGGGTNDPSTQMVHAIVSWEEGRTIKLGQYFTRSKETVLFQNNWRNGSGQTGPVTGVLNGYDSASNMTANVLLALSTTTASGTLTSSIFDTQIAGGAAINSVLWQGLLNGGATQFQFAYANSPSGPWNFYGPGASPSTYYTPTNSGIPLAVTDIHNYRYFRYKIFLAPSGTSTPTVTSVSVGWSW